MRCATPSGGASHVPRRSRRTAVAARRCRSRGAASPPARRHRWPAAAVRRHGRAVPDVHLAHRRCRPPQRRPRCHQLRRRRRAARRPPPPRHARPAPRPRPRRRLGSGQRRLRGLPDLLRLHGGDVRGNRGGLRGIQGGARGGGQTRHDVPAAGCRARQSRPPRQRQSVRRFPRRSALRRPVEIDRLRLPPAGDGQRPLPLPWRQEHRPAHRGRAAPRPRRRAQARHALR